MVVPDAVLILVGSMAFFMSLIFWRAATAPFLRRHDGESLFRMSTLMFGFFADWIRAVHISLKRRRFPNAGVAGHVLSFAVFIAVAAAGLLGGD